MTKKSAIKPLAAALGTVFTITLANSAVSNAAENPFSMEPLSSGYMTLAENNDAEGKSGGDKKGKGKHGGMLKMDTNSDGNISKEEFMKGHEAKFDKIDKNGDGVIDASEREAHMKHKKKGKGGEGKCGGSKQE